MFPTDMNIPSNDEESKELRKRSRENGGDVKMKRATPERPTIKRYHSFAGRTEDSMNFRSPIRGAAFPPELVLQPCTSLMGSSKNNFLRRNLSFDSFGDFQSSRIGFGAGEGNLSLNGLEIDENLPRYPQLLSPQSDFITETSYSRLSQESSSTFMLDDVDEETRMEETRHCHQTPTREESFRSLKRNCNSIVVQVVQACINKSVKMVVIDLDNTLLEIHTNGAWGYSAQLLSYRIRPCFNQLIHALLKEGVNIAIATYSEQESLVQELMMYAFKES
jgi:hypothetical protein